MGWTVTHESNGTLRWRTPTGFTYWTEPGGLWPPRPAPPPPERVVEVPVGHHTHRVRPDEFLAPWLACHAPSRDTLYSNER